jgi:hypothetical protein
MNRSPVWSNAAALGRFILLGAIVAWLPGSAAGEQRKAAPASAASVLAAAFANRYEIDMLSNIELIMRNRAGKERVRRFRAASKVIGDRTHSIGRLMWPSYLRGMTILTIEAKDRGHDAFVYLPSIEKVRRISTAQRSDSFLGSDVTYEDIERRRVEEYEIDGVEAGESAGEAVHVVRARSKRRFTYDRVAFLIAASDHAILEARYFKVQRDEPFRVVSSPRRYMVERDGHVIPTRITVTDTVRGTTTEVVFNDLEINPTLADEVFSVSTLERQRALPGQQRAAQAASPVEP